MPATKSKSRRGAPPPPAKNSAKGPRPQSAPADDLTWIQRNAEGLWPAGVGLLSAVIYMASFSSNVQFGDSAESVAGVKSLGIVHAPGYVSYIVAARLFTIIEPFGSLAFRVNLFSVACSVAAVVMTYFIGRRLHLRPSAAAFGAMTLAVSQSVWFYATFAKAYAFTVLLLAAVLLLVVAWRDDGRVWRLYVAAALVGIGAGASYQVILLSIPGFLVFVFGRGRRPTLRQVVAGAAITGVATASVLGFIVIRARQHPAMNWGGVVSTAGLIDLYSMKDFGFGERQLGGNRVVIPTGESTTTTTLPSTSSGSATASTTTVPASTTTTLPDAAPESTRADPSTSTSVGAAPALSGMLTRVIVSPVRVLLFPLRMVTDLGVVAAVLGVVGAVRLWMRRHRDRWALAAIFVGNVVGAGAVVGGVRISVGITSPELILSLGGFYLAATLVYALLAAFGADAVIEWALGAVRNRHSRAERRRQQRGDIPRLSWQPIVIGVLGLSLVAALVLNWGYTSKRMTPYASDYARNVFATLPQNTVLLTWDATRAFVLEEEQIVNNTRRDVQVVRIEQIGRPWYRQQLAFRLGIDVTALRGNLFQQAAHLAQRARAKGRPAYLDNASTYYISKVAPDLGFRQLGLVAEVVDGSGKQPSDLARMDTLFKSTYIFRGFDDEAVHQFPNDSQMLQYMYAFLDYGTALGKAKRYDDAINAFRNALVFDPTNNEAHADIQLALEKKQSGG